jgi:hypothetical protein
MRSFTDSTGRSWQLEVLVGTIKRVRALAGVDLLGVLEGVMLDKLASDAVLLVDVLYACCKEQADGLGISDEQFGRSMTGDALEAGSLALLEALADFFPSRQRLLLRQALAQAATMADQLLAQTAASLEAMPGALPPSAAGS